MNEQNTETHMQWMMSKCYDMILSAEELNSCPRFNTQSNQIVHLPFKSHFVQVHINCSNESTLHFPYYALM